MLYGLLCEVEAQLRGGMAMTNVTWLTSPAVGSGRAGPGFAPGDRAGIIDAMRRT
ncbi:MAG: hypothetical protein WKF73_07480 [Nocardioidaceae bacterium]